MHDAHHPPQLPADLAALAAELAGLTSLEDRIALTGRRLGAGVAFSTSLGLEDQAVLHAIAAVRAGGGTPIDVFTLDTGRHFPETYDVIAASERRYGLRIRVVAPEAAALERLVSRDGVNGFRTSIGARKACCDVRKVAPLRLALAGARGWITGLRRGQAQGRTDVPFANFDAVFGVPKVSPLADWPLAQLEAYVAANDIPVNALHAKGFPSIGCQPCTRAIEPGEDIRAGRWWWEQEGKSMDGNPMDGKECGLHQRPAAPKLHAGLQP
jgi:phosphoadenosine phosphosulfate reductase